TIPQPNTCFVLLDSMISPSCSLRAGSRTVQRDRAIPRVVPERFQRGRLPDLLARVADPQRLLQGVERALAAPELLVHQRGVEEDGAVSGAEPECLQQLGVGRLVISR